LPVIPKKSRSAAARKGRKLREEGKRRGTKSGKE